VIFILLLRAFFLICSYKRNNPLTSGILLILRLVVISPLISIITLTWYIYLLLLLFLRGVFVLVIYVSTFSSFYTKGVGGVWWLICIGFFFPSFMYFYISVYTGIRRLFIASRLGLIFFLILFLSFLILWTRYIITGKGAMRKF